MFMSKWFAIKTNNMSRSGTSFHPPSLWIFKWRVKYSRTVEMVQREVVVL